MSKPRYRLHVYLDRGRLRWVLSYPTSQWEYYPVGSGDTPREAINVCRLTLGLAPV